MAEAEPGAAGGYVAFISYSHKDAAVGRWLHRKLEGYRLPKRLAGTQGDDGEIPERLTPIFRDRDELPAAGDLSEKVRAALAVSKNLIVLCSPHSAASPWVAKEITTFRELHPGRPVFTAIVDGEPGQCFSPALLEGGTEPLAADLRKEGDGRRLGLLKLVAGLSGLGLDALVQRDAARRVRHVTYVTATAVTAMLVMALLTAFALNARAEAQRQREEAEGLVEFMLTDLRERLRGVGRIEIMERVNERALTYYGNQPDLSALSDSSLARRARVVQVIGDDHLDQEDTDAALVAYSEAWNTTAAQAARAPEDPQRLFEHAKTLNGLARAYEIRKNWEAAERYFRDLAAASDKLLRKRPEDPEFLMKAASAAVGLGNVRLGAAKDYEGGQRFYERALTFLNRAAAKAPNDGHVLLAQANAYGWLADSLFYRRQFAPSLRARLKQRIIVQRLYAADQQNADHGARMIAAERGVACSLLHLGRRSDGHARLKKAYSTANDVLSDKKHARWQALRNKLATDLEELERPDRVSHDGAKTGPPRCVPESTRELPGNLLG